VPHGEEEEIRQIFRRKGFEGDLLDRVVAVITQNREVWVETMLKEELGLTLSGPVPWKAALATFVAFIVIGFIPLIPFVLLAWFQLSQTTQFWISLSITGLTFFGIGALKSLFTPEHWLRAGIETFLIGGGAAGLAYGVGVLFKGIG
jgi:VIT1/CCC1 family predicted Fe2+/Mn2+ transporter